MRLTKIVCTLGPASFSKEGIKQLADEGMAVARFNFSHGSHESHMEVFERVRELNQQGYCIATLLDTKGSEIRTGDVTEPIVLKAGQEVVLTHSNDKKYDGTIIKVNYKEFSHDAKDCKTILVDNGEMIFDVLSVEKDWVTVRVQGDGSIGSRRHLNLPGAHLSLDSVTEKDFEDLALGCKEGFDFTALSFIQTADEVKKVRAFIEKNGGHMQIISKIENVVGVQNIDEIIDASDGIMVARGDLGAEVPPETVPSIQDDIVEKCRLKAKPVIVATHMLESMIVNPLPTRAEVTDIAHAAVTGADSTMLSGETAKGKYPFQALNMMGRVLAETEKNHPPMFVVGEDIFTERHEAFANAAVSMAISLEAKAIILFTRSMTTAQAVSHLRPPVPIIAITHTAETQRTMNLLYGVVPLHIPFGNDPAEMVQMALEAVKERKLLKKNDPVVIITTMNDQGQTVNTVQNRVIA